ncbi:MAG: gluconokinase [Hyphomicrobiaceae bacterium]
MIVVVMGVSGCGKSSVGQAIAARTGWTFIEGDDLHPEANRAKMASGKPLDDDDRWPWLDAIAETARDIEANGGSVVVACSALKKSYRDRLARAGSAVKFIHLDGDRELILERMHARADHFMPPGLLDSQFATLEAPAPGPLIHAFDISSSVDDIAGRAVAAIGPPSATQ